MCCMLSTFHVSSWIVANISESSLLFSQYRFRPCWGVVNKYLYFFFGRVELWFGQVQMPYHSSEGRVHPKFRFYHWMTQVSFVSSSDVWLNLFKDIQEFICIFCHFSAFRLCRLWVEILPYGRQGHNSTKSIPWLLMASQHEEPCHQQSWYWPNLSGFDTRSWQHLCSTLVTLALIETVSIKHHF